MQEALRQLQSSLKESGHSLTTPREAVFQALLDQEPQTINELAKRLAGRVDRASVYRIVALFEQLGIVNRLQLGWKYKLELSDTYTDHHHHLTCLKCGRVIEIEENNIIEYELRQLAMEADFELTGHQLELRGICRSCKSR